MPATDSRSVPASQPLLEELLPDDAGRLAPADESEGTVALLSVAVSAGVPVPEFDGLLHPVNPPAAPHRRRAPASETTFRLMLISPP